jgi:hypothetical protein
MFREGGKVVVVVVVRAERMELFFYKKIELAVASSAEGVSVGAGRRYTHLILDLRRLQTGRGAAIAIHGSLLLIESRRRRPPADESARHRLLTLCWPWCVCRRAAPPPPPKFCILLDELCFQAHLSH